MKSHIRFVFRMLLMVLALQFVPVEGYMPVAQAATTAQQKAKAKAKKQKEKEKAKKQKEKEKAKAAAAKEKEREAAANNDYEEVISDKPVHYFNLSPKVGYVAGFNKPAFADSHVFGGGGAGFGFEYELEYRHFLFDLGLDIDWLHGISKYDMQYNYTTAAPYDMTYTHRYVGFNVDHSMTTVGLPIRMGAQFKKFYFLLGAKVGYSFMGKYSAWGTYDVMAKDNLTGLPIGGNNPQAGTGVFQLERGEMTGAMPTKLPTVRALAEVGLDLDRWLQAPEPKKKPKSKKGAKYEPFTKHDIHYRLGLFAEYDVLNVMDFAGADRPANVASSSNSLNDLFVGAKFTVQFAVPDKKPKRNSVSVPPTMLRLIVLDKETNEPVPMCFLDIKNVKADRMVGKSREIKNGDYKQRFSRGMFELCVHDSLYYPDTIQYEVAELGKSDSLTAYLTKRPVLKVRVVNGETGEAVRAKVAIHHARLAKPLQFPTDAAGATQTILEDGTGYNLTVDVKGFEPYNVMLASIGEDLEVRLVPIKVGKTFVLKNMFFATNKTKILPDSEPALEMLYEYMTDEQNATRRIKIVGHTDNVGKDAANQKLSEGRAQAVREALIERGIDASRLEAEGRGETEPIDTNDTEEGRQNNRRVEIEVLE